MRAVIGITAWPAAIPQDHIAIPVQSVPDDYLELLDHVGLAALVIPVNGPVGDVAALVGRIDGVLLTGGGDVAPARYAAQQQPETTGVNPQRDEVEIELVRLACRRALEHRGTSGPADARHTAAPATRPGGERQLTAPPGPRYGGTGSAGGSATH